MNIVILGVQGTPTPIPTNVRVMLDNITIGLLIGVLVLAILLIIMTKLK